MLCVLLLLLTPDALLPLPPPLPQAKTPEAQALLKELSAAHSFYVTPAGSNDDWWVAGWLGGWLDGWCIG